MSSIHPFIAVRPQSNHAAEVSCPPYDVMSTQEARDQASRTSESFVKVIRAEVDFPDTADPHSSEVYAQAHKNLERMIQNGTFQVDAEPGLLAYRLVFQGRRQVGLVCTVDAAEYRENRIRKHEKTRPDKEDDRTRHLMAVSSHAEPVLLSWRDELHAPEIVDALNTAMAERPLSHFVTDDVTHTLWKIKNPEEYVELFKSVPELYIADGHHRSAAGERVSKQCESGNPDHTGDEEYNRILAVIFPESQLTILPYNRVVRDLNGHSGENFLEALRKVGNLEPLNGRPHTPEKRGTLNIYLAGEWHQLTFNDGDINHDDPIESLDVALLQDRILSPILNIGDPRTDQRIGFVGGIRGHEELEHKVVSGEWSVAFSMHETSMEELLRVADANEIMPPKSTWFEPKLRSGLFLHRFDIPESVKQ